MIQSQATVKVADEVWVAVALLHREQARRKDFTVQEIVDRIVRERLHPSLRPGVSIHVYQHCVANSVPNSGRYRMLIGTGKNTRRIFQPGDEYHPDREGGKAVPRREDLPEKYWPLLDWYEKKFGAKKSESPVPAMQALKGMWKGLWKDEDPDAYVRRLREWD